MSVPHSRSRPHPRSHALFATIAALALAATACAAPTESSDPADDSASGDPQAIVSLSPTTTEMLYAVGAGDNVVAVDDRSNYPENAPVTDLSGYTPNLEAILGYEPDLVVATDDNGGIVAGLERVGVEVLLLPAGENLDDTYSQLEQVGAATGHVGEAAKLVGQMQSEVDEIVASVPQREEPLTYFHELDETLFTVTDQTFIGNVYSMLGLTSVATGDNPYPQLSEELLLESDPNYVFLADAQCCGVTPEAVAERPGWDGLSAVKDDRVIVVNEDLASRWGPRVVDLLRELAATVATTAPEPQPAGAPTP